MSTFKEFAATVRRSKFAERKSTFTWITTTSRGIRDSTYDRSNFAGLFEERGNSTIHNRIALASAAAGLHFQPYILLLYLDHAWQGTVSSKPCLFSLKFCALEWPTVMEWCHGVRSWAVRAATSPRSFIHARVRRSQRARRAFDSKREIILPIDSISHPRSNATHVHTHTNAVIPRLTAAGRLFGKVFNRCLAVSSTLSRMKFHSQSCERYDSPGSTF